MAMILIAFVVATKPLGFETILYKIMELTGFFLIFIAVSGRIWCTLYIAGRKNRELCTSGPYELCRNPLYFFSFIGFMGVFLAAQSIILAVVAAAIFLVYYAGVIKGEEIRLHSLFGEPFKLYLESTPKFWPRLFIPKESHTLLVNSSIFTRSLREVIWFLFAIILVEVIEMLKVARAFDFFILPY